MSKITFLFLISVLGMSSGQAMMQGEPNWSNQDLRALGEISNRFIVEYKDDKDSEETKTTSPLTQDELNRFLQNIGDRFVLCIRLTEPTFPVSDQCGRSFIVSYEKDGEVLESNPLNQAQLNVFLRNIKYLVVGVRLDQPIHEVEDSPDIDIN